MAEGDIQVIEQLKGDPPSGVTVATARPAGSRDYGATGTRLLRALALRPETTPVFGLAIAIVIFSVLSPLFLTKETAITVASASSELGIAAVPVTLLMISGNFDLSVGAITAMSGYGALLALRLGADPLVAVIAALLTGVLVGVVNGTLVVVTKMHSFVVTLGTMLIMYSVLDILVNGVPTNLGMNIHWEDALSGPKLGGFYMSLAYFVGLTVLGTFFLLRTKAGNWTYAMGQNRNAAQNLGVPISRMTIILFAVSGFGGGVVGLVEAAQYNTVQPTGGTDLELYIIAVVVIGGASLFGGYGSAIGTFLGAVIYGTIEVGIVLAKATGELFDALVGAGLFLSVMVNEFVLRRGALLGRKRTTPSDLRARFLGRQR